MDRDELRGQQAYLMRRFPSAGKIGGSKARGEPCPDGCCQHERCPDCSRSVAHCICTLPKAA